MVPICLNWSIIRGQGVSRDAFTVLLGDSLIKYILGNNRLLVLLVMFRKQGEFFMLYDRTYLSKYLPINYIKFRNNLS
jgi:hypothetical protein